MTFKVLVSGITPMSSYQASEVMRQHRQDSVDYMKLQEKAGQEFLSKGYGPICKKMEEIFSRRFAQDMKCGESTQTLFAAFSSWVKKKITLVQLNHPEYRPYTNLESEFHHAISNLRYPDSETVPAKEKFLGLLVRVEDILTQLGEESTSIVDLGEMIYDHPFLLDATIGFIKEIVLPKGTRIGVEALDALFLMDHILNQMQQDLVRLAETIQSTNLYDYSLIKNVVRDIRQDVSEGFKKGILQLHMMQASLIGLFEGKIPKWMIFAEWNALFYCISRIIPQILRINDFTPIQIFAQTEYFYKPGTMVVTVDTPESFDVLRDHITQRNQWHYDYDAFIASPYQFVADLLQSFVNAFESNPGAWKKKMHALRTEWNKRKNLDVQVSEEEIDKLWASEKKKGKNPRKAVKHSSKSNKKLKVPVVAVEAPLPAPRICSLRSVIESHRSAGLGSRFGLQALCNARSYEADLLLTSEMLKKPLSKEQLSPLTLVAIRISALYLEQLFKSDQLDLPDEPDQALAIHNLKKFKGKVVEDEKSLVNRLFLAHYWVDYPEQQMMGWINARRVPELLKMVTHAFPISQAHIDQSKIAQLVQEVLAVGRRWLSEKTGEVPAQTLPEAVSVNLQLNKLNLNHAKKEIQNTAQLSETDKNALQRSLTMVEYCLQAFKAPFTGQQISFALRHSLHWMHLSLESALRIIIKQKWSFISKDHDLNKLAKIASVKFNKKEENYVEAYFSSARNLSSYPYEFTNSINPLEQIMKIAEEGEEFHPRCAEILKVFFDRFQPLFLKILKNL